MVDLQCCVSFWYTEVGQLCIYTYVYVLFQILFLLAAPHGVLDLNSPTSNWTALRAQNPNHQPTRERPPSSRGNQEAGFSGCLVKKPN